MSNVENKLELEMSKLVGKECWGIIAGKGTGSFVNFEIGHKIPRKKVIENPSLGKALRNYEGEYNLSLECAWRLDSDKEVICGAWDDNSKGGKMLEGLNLLVGRRITRISLSKPSWDLTVEFSDALTLKIFCDQTNEKDRNDNYMLFTPAEIITVGHKGRLESEQRDS